MEDTTDALLVNGVSQLSPVKPTLIYIVTKLEESEGETEITKENQGTN